MLVLKPAIIYFRLKAGTSFLTIKSTIKLQNPG